MEKINAIIQISVLLLVAGGIGFVTAWIYWKNRQRSQARDYENRLAEQRAAASDAIIARDQFVAQVRSLKYQLEAKEKQNMELSRDFVPDKLYSKIVRNMGEGVSVSDDEGYFLVFNPKLEEITGYTKAEANKHTEKLFLEKIYPDVELREQVARDINSIPEGDEYTNIKTLITTKSGEEVPVLVSSTIVNYKSKKYYLSAYRDVSTKPKVEAERHVKEKAT